VENFKIKGAILAKVRQETPDDFQYIRLLNAMEQMNMYARRLGVTVDVVDIETKIENPRFRIYVLTVDCDRDVGNALSMKLISLQKFTSVVCELYQLEIAE